MTVTKAQIVEDLFVRNLFTKGESAHIIETLFELIKQSLERGDMDESLFDTVNRCFIIVLQRGI